MIMMRMTQAEAERYKELDGADMTNVKVVGQRKSVTKPRKKYDVLNAESQYTLKGLDTEKIAKIVGKSEAAVRSALRVINNGTAETVFMGQYVVQRPREK